jgi:hypothetical protein
LRIPFAHSLDAAIATDRCLALSARRPARLLLLLLGVASLLVALKDLGRHADSPAVFANALACVWLTVAVVGICSGRSLGLARGVLIGTLVLGCLRAVVSAWGVPMGWTLSEEMDAQGQVATSQSMIGDLDFGPGAVPAHLINDGGKFNFYAARDMNLDRTKLPVALTATAFVAGQGSLRISSSSPIRITVGSEVTELRPPIVDYERELSLPGEERIEISMAPTEVDRAALRVQPIGVQLYAQPTADQMMSVHRWLGRLASVLDLFVIVGSLWIVARVARHGLAATTRRRLLPAALVALVLFLVLAPELLTWFSQHDSLPVLSGGDDWLTYETFARDIRDNSPLMLMGKPMGQADAFYYQPLYSYVVALGHLVVGESVQGIVLLQLLGMGLVFVLVFLSLPENASRAIALALVVLGTGIFREWVLMAGRLLSENLLMVLFAALLCVISRLKPVPSTASMALVGVLLGIAMLARSTSWVIVPFVLVLLLRGVPRRELASRVIVVLAPIIMLAVLVPVRNVVAAGTPALLPTSGSVNLYMGNVPAGRKLTSEPWIGWSKSYDARLVAVAEAVVNAPDQVAKKLSDKAIYVLGFPRSLDSDNPVLFWPILSLWIMAPLAALTRRHSRLASACLILAISHCLTLILIFPNTYFYRLEMPATLPLAIWDTIAVAQILDGLPDPSGAGRQFKRAVARLGMAGGGRGEAAPEVVGP